MAEKTEYKKIPKMSTNSAGAPIAVNPKKIPLTWTNEILKELYDFDTGIDAEPTWKTNKFKTYTTDVTTNTVTYEGDGGVCDQPGSSGSTPTTTKLTLHRWYTVARDQENLKKGRAGVWIRRTGLTDDTDRTSTAYRLRTPRASGTGGLNSGASIHPPAIPIKPVPPPQPQPTFIPTAPKPSKIKIDPSLQKFMKSVNGKLKAVQSEQDCEEAGFYPVLVQKWQEDDEGNIIKDEEGNPLPCVDWECLPPTSGGCSFLVKMRKVPERGYGAGTAVIITSISDDGACTVSETEVPVYIPRL